MRKSTAKKKRYTSDDTSSGHKDCCERHPERIAAISTATKGRCCWECYLPADVFEKRYGNEYERKYGRKFYEPGGPGYAGELKPTTNEEKS